MEAASDAHLLAEQLRASGEFEAVVSGLTSIAVRFDPGEIKARAVEEAVQAAWHAFTPDAPQDAPAERVIAVQYGGIDGPDLDAVCDQTGLSAEAVIKLHCSRAYSVDMIGFTPGFAYLSGLPDALNVPRLETPRVRLPAGSVGIAAGYSGLYALQGPGGWPIIGRTADVLFDPNQADPFRVTPGMRVRFQPA